MTYNPRTRLIPIQTPPYDCPDYYISSDLSTYAAYVLFRPLTVPHRLPDRPESQCCSGHFPPSGGFGLSQLGSPRPPCPIGNGAVRRLIRHRTVTGTPDEVKRARRVQRDLQRWLVGR
jgi:hypothetical protein